MDDVKRMEVFETMYLKCTNGMCGWEARTREEYVEDDCGNKFCPICGRLLAEKTM